MAIKWQRTLALRGGSFFVSIPPEIVRTLGWVPGDPLEVWMDESFQAAVVRKEGKPRAAGSPGDGLHEAGGVNM